MLRYSESDYAREQREQSWQQRFAWVPLIAAIDTKRGRNIWVWLDHYEFRKVRYNSKYRGFRQLPSHLEWESYGVEWRG